MARKRMIDPDFWTDEKLGLCKRDERLFFMGLISNADDEGRGRGNIKLLKATIFPYDDDLKSKDIEQMACSLMEKGMAIFYVVDDQEFYCLPNFARHQTINKPTQSKIPEMPENREKVVLPQYYRSPPVELPPKRKEEKRKEEKRAREEFVFLSDREYENLIAEYGENDTKQMIEILNNYKGSTGKTYKSDFMAIKNWVVKRLAEDKQGAKAFGQQGKKPRAPSESSSPAAVLRGGNYEIYTPPDTT